MALRDILHTQNRPVAFGAKRTSMGELCRLNWLRLTPSGPD